MGSDLRRDCRCVVIACRNMGYSSGYGGSGRWAKVRMIKESPGQAVAALWEGLVYPVPGGGIGHSLYGGNSCPDLGKHHPTGNRCC